MTWTHPKRKSAESALWVRAAYYTRRLLKEMELPEEEAEALEVFASKCASLGAYARQGRVI